MLRVELDLVWRIGNRAPARFDGALFVLLEAIAESGSLRTAAKRAGMSYRHAWGQLTAWAQTLGRPLASLERGRGTRLTALGNALLAARREIEERLGPELTRAAADVTTRLSKRDAGMARTLTIHASHDIALLKARDRLAEAHDLEIDLQVHGSHDCLDALARRRCDLAGFHAAPDDALELVLGEVFPRGLPEPVRVFRLFRREQGLLTRPGHTPPLRTLAEIASSGSRFINRQRGSGTRTLIDRLLRQAGVSPAELRGYQDEEFTHLAVAATVAGGGADAGFAIHAAAVQFGLKFTPLATEAYYLACREARARDEGIQRLVAFLRGGELQAICGQLPGYDARGVGESVRIGTRRQRRHRLTGA